MAQIAVRDLTRHFRVPVHRPGFLGTLRSLFARRYRLIRAVDGISFEIGAGELVGYIGPNGAGKSTTVKILAGLLVPTDGAVQVAGRVPWREREAHVARIGAVFGQRTTLWWDLPVIESLEMLRYIYRVPADRFRRNLADFRDLLDLDPFLETPVRALSLGQRMRADLCAALLHDPAILFLDEPTIGLDVVARERIRRFIRHVNRDRGTTIMLTTHDLFDVEKLCSRVLIIDRGRLLYDGDLPTLRRRFGGTRELVVDLADDYPEIAVAHARVVGREGRRVTLRFERGDTTASDLIGRLSDRYRIRDLSVRESEITDIVRRIYEEQLLV